MKKISIKKVVWFVLLLFGTYICMTIIYFSMNLSMHDPCASVIYECNQPIILTDGSHTYKTINDASCLNKTRVFDIIKIYSIDDIQKALKNARERGLKVSVTGVRHSMGGQAFNTDALVLDMTSFNKILSFDSDKAILKVQAGATWHEIQKYLHPNFAVKSMQSSDIFTVGGSISVNAHGMDHNSGAIASTLRSITLMNYQGVLENITESGNPELFNAVIGGYGLFGIIVDAEIEVTKNVMYRPSFKMVSPKDFESFFESTIQPNKKYGLFYGHLSTSPLSFLNEVMIYSYKEVDDYQGTIKPLKKISLVNIRRFLINLSKRRTYAQVVKWVAEKYIDPYITRFTYPFMNREMLYKGKHPLLSRNEVMHDSVEYLENILVNETDILHEYFVPRNKLTAFIDSLKTITKKYKATLLNASIRVVEKQYVLLNYAPQDMFSVVLYFNQKVSKAALQSMEKLTQELIDVTVNLDGRFFLPYQLYYTKDQLKKAYPMIDEFFALKKKYDPDELFMNKFYAKYALKNLTH